MSTWLYTFVNKWQDVGFVEALVLSQLLPGEFWDSPYDSYWNSKRPLFVEVIDKVNKQLRCWILHVW